MSPANSSTSAFQARSSPVAAADAIRATVAGSRRAAVGRVVLSWRCMVNVGITCCTPWGDVVAGDRRDAPGRLDERRCAHLVAAYQRPGGPLCLSMRALWRDGDDQQRTAWDGDERLLDGLRGVLATVDPTPDRVLDAGRMSFALRELAALPAASPRMRPAT